MRNTNTNEMYTVSQKFGIGQVESIENGKVTVYFAEEDVTKVLIEKLTTIYSTIEAAELALNPEMTQEESNEILANIEAGKKAAIEGRNASNLLQMHNAESSKKLMKNI